MVDLFVVHLKQPTSVVIYFKTHLPRYPILWDLPLYDEQNSVTLSDPHSFKMFHWTIPYLLSPIVKDPSCLLNITELSLLCYGNPPSNPLLTIHMAELSDNSTVFKGAWVKWHKNGTIVIILIHQTQKTVKTERETVLRCLGEKTQVRESCGHFSVKTNESE